VSGRDENVIVAAEEFRRLKGDRTGEALIAALQASPYRDIDIELRPHAPSGARCETVTGWLLDTNILSELRRTKPDPKVVGSIASKPLDLLFVIIVTFAEIRFGIKSLSDATRRAALNDWLAHRCGRCSRNAPSRCASMSCSNGGSWSRTDAKPGTSIRSPI
jgi:hypothetical protein